MKTAFKPASTPVLTEINDKIKKKENFVTGEVEEIVQQKEQLKEYHGHYTLEFFDEGGKLVEKVEADNATPIIYSQLGTTRQLNDVGLVAKANKFVWSDFQYPKFFDEGYIFFTNEDGRQEENVQGAIPSGRVSGFTTIDKAYSGDNVFAGSLNTSLCTVESGHHVTTLTYVSDFALERANGTFDTCWLGHVSNGRSETDFSNMQFKCGGQFKPVDFLSPKLNASVSNSKFTFFPLDGYTYFGQDWANKGFYIYQSQEDSNDFTLQVIDVLDNFKNLEESGVTVYNNKPAIFKRKAVATNQFELMCFDLVKDSAFTLTSSDVIKLSTASLPNHADLRLMHVKSFDNALYAIFKPLESYGKEAVLYVVKYSHNGQTYYNHLTFNYTTSAYNVAMDQYKMQNSVDVYRINDVDYFVLAYENGMNHQYATVYYHPITNESQVLTKDVLNAFVTTPGSDNAIWRQLEPNGLFFSQSMSSQELKMMALMAPFSHTKIPTTVKDSSQSMRVTYTIKIYHNVCQQYLPNISSQEVFHLPNEDKKGIIGRIKSVFSS